ncbi:MAG: cobalamin-dependent protein [Actinomycetia bacterium]|nr:cobalamin-dependent protein [Actinomycetes bacterium]
MGEIKNKNNRKQYSLKSDEKIDVLKILKDLDKYKPRRKGWTWRKKLPKGTKIGQFIYGQVSEDLKNSQPLPAAHYFGNIDPQPDCIITSEIASGRFEDDIRRFRMAAYHGADHIMVIRTAGQSHFDGLIEGTPEGVGGVPITRKQVRASRKALDLIEDEVGRPINFHSYVSGVAGPEIAVLFNEEGVNGAHQDPQYNILYRGINMYRSFVDAAEAKKIMADAKMLQIDGAHNANATAKQAWKVMPELLVQHSINCAFSIKAGMPKNLIALSTVPPTSAPAPCIKIDLPYAVALRDFFEDFIFRAQMNTRYMESCTREVTVSHTLNSLISRLTSAHLQSTITPDEGRNVPWHYNSIHGVNTAKQTLIALDSIKELVEIKNEGILKEKVREIKERAILFLEEILKVGGYFEAVEQGFFVDSGCYPERANDGIIRYKDGGVAAGTIIKRDKDYFAPVCCHFGYNNLSLAQEITGKRVNNKVCDLIDGCTLCVHEKISYIDELDEVDNVNIRLSKSEEYRTENRIKPEVQWAGDGVIVLAMFLPVDERTSHFASLEIARKFGLKETEVVHKQIMHPAEGTYVEVKGMVPFSIDLEEIEMPEIIPNLEPEYIESIVREKDLKVVAATVGEDEHSVGMREIIDIKHGGIEKFGFKCYYLGTSVSIDKVIDAAIEVDAKIILISTIITHGEIHRINIRRLNQLAVEKGIRDKVILIAGGTQIKDQMAKEEGLDAGFGRGTKGIDVASFIIRKLIKDK